MLEVDDRMHELSQKHVGLGSRAMLILIELASKKIDEEASEMAMET
jgi:hypothetical protein